MTPLWLVEWVGLYLWVPAAAAALLNVGYQRGRILRSGLDGFLDDRGSPGPLFLAAGGAAAAALLPYLVLLGPVVLVLLGAAGLVWAGQQGGLRLGAPARRALEPDPQDLLEAERAADPFLEEGAIRQTLLGPIRAHRPPPPTPTPGPGRVRT